jgi:hypothetical protein
VPGQAGTVKIRLGRAPQPDPVRRRYQPRDNAGGKSSGERAILLVTIGAEDFVQDAAREPAPRQSPIDRGDPKRQHAMHCCGRLLDPPNPFAKRRQEVVWHELVKIQADRFPICSFSGRLSIALVHRPNPDRTRPISNFSRSLQTRTARHRPARYRSVNHSSPLLFLFLRVPIFRQQRRLAMWWWFVLWVIVIWLIFSSFGYYGYRRSYYYDSWGPSGGLGLLVVLFIVFWLVIVFGGPYWGWYGWWW